MASSEDPHQPFHWHHAELEDRDYQIRGRTVFFAILLFVTVLIFTLLFAYIRWACSFYQDTAYPSSRPLPPPPPQLRGLDPATINALPITTITCGRGPLEECCICLGVFEDGEKVKILPSCKHSYHSECVDRWLSAESSCPLCRAPLRVESVLHQVPVIVTQ